VNIEQKIFTDINQLLQADRLVRENARKGLCRKWTRFAMEATSPLVELSPESIQIEAREVDIEPCLSHTFLRAIIHGKKFILDGTGASTYDPYSGPEDEAPNHLQNSRSDMINNC